VKKRAVILYRYIPQYRLDFYTRLYDLCKRANIDLDVIYGNPSPIDTKKGDSVDFLSPENSLTIIGFPSVGLN